MSSITIDPARRDIALQYLSLSARKLSEATNLEQSLAESAARLRYIALAIKYGCTEKEMCFALSISVQHLRELVALTGGL